MRRPIAYYVHHHGDGHRQRAVAIARQAPERFVLIGTGLAGKVEGLRCLDLPDDVPARDHDTDVVDGLDQPALALHYAPYDVAGVRERVARVASWIARERPAAMVVDVSVEIAMLARLTSTPTIYVRLAGARNDPAHLEAFRSAKAILAPFHRDLDDSATPVWVARATTYVAGLTSISAIPPGAPNVVLFIQGRGGVPGDGDAIASAARATPDLQWRAMGPISQSQDRPPNLTLLGWVDNVHEEIAGAGIVVGAGGDGVVNAVIAAGRPFICMPESRPFDEQRSKAARLGAVGAAVVLNGWPAPEAWPDLVQQARALSPEAQARLHDRNGVTKAAAFLMATAADEATRPQPLKLDLVA